MKFGLKWDGDMAFLIAIEVSILTNALRIRSHRIQTLMMADSIQNNHARINLAILNEMTLSIKERIEFGAKFPAIKKQKNQLHSRTGVLHSQTVFCTCLHYMTERKGKNQGAFLREGQR